MWGGILLRGQGELDVWKGHGDSRNQTQGLGILTSMFKFYARSCHIPHFNRTQTA